MNRHNPEVTKAHRMIGNAALLAVVFALVLNIAFYAWARPARIIRPLGVMAEVRQMLLEGYVDEPDDGALIEAGIRGMVDSLDDPNTVFFNADQLQQFDEHVSGKYSGIGAGIDLKEDRLLIVTPFEDSPAWQAGLMSGDLVLEIDGKDTLGITILEAREQLMGEAGTQVSVLVRHRDGETESLTITRGVITVSTVRSIQQIEGQGLDFMLDHDNQIGYVRLTNFDQQSQEDMQGALESLKAQGMAGLIIDLRGNGGGLLNAAVGISDMFLTEDQTIVTIRSRIADDVVYRSTDQTLFPDIPVAVLVNATSASASEILAGALQDNDRAMIIGTRSYGKGSVQENRPLSNGEVSLKMTTAHWYVPSGRMIHREPDSERWGVDPSPGGYVLMTNDELVAMIDRMRDNRSANPFVDYTGPMTPDWLQENLLDAQLAAGLEAVQGHVVNGGWPAVGESDADAMVALGHIEALQFRRAELATALANIDVQLEELGVEAGNDDAASATPDVEEAPAPNQAPEPAGVGGE